MTKEKTWFYRGDQAFRRARAKVSAIGGDAHILTADEARACDVDVPEATQSGRPVAYVVVQTLDATEYVEPE